MKKIFLIFVCVCFLAFLVISSCTDDDDDVSTGTLKVITTPTGLNNEIYVDGELQGTETVTSEVNTGRYLIEGGAVEGYTTPDSQWAEVEAGQTIDIELVYTVYDPTPTPTPTAEVTATPTPTPEGLIIPLADGNTWYMDRYETAKDRKSEIRTVTGQQEIEGTTVYIYYINIYDNEGISLSSDYLFFNNLSDGLYWYGDDDQGFVSPILVFKYPAFTGDSYPIWEDSTITVLSTSESITVPAGMFSCMLYHETIETTDYNIYYYIAADVGIVKIMVYFEGELNYTSELRHYSLF
ncbi:hypothetical protein ACFL27_11595 [candidate division CSSED10-310 bacterium]|uniref:PEGA domain-containing protein n=1 Tax=candidate division CSSED10-310 bacterium TaxID=2855610 RepID=A0ABV6YXN6_UNCC1